MASLGGCLCVLFAFAGAPVSASVSFSFFFSFIIFFFFFFLFFFYYFVVIYFCFFFFIFLFSSSSVSSSSTFSFYCSLCCYLIFSSSPSSSSSSSFTFSSSLVCLWCCSAGQYVVIQPEGTRSRSGTRMRGFAAWTCTSGHRYAHRRRRHLEYFLSFLYRVPAPLQCRVFLAVFLYSQMEANTCGYLYTYIQYIHIKIQEFV